MGLFGRSKADQDLIEMQGETIKAQREHLRRAYSLFTHVHFRDPATGKIGAKGAIPGSLREQLNAQP